MSQRLSRSAARAHTLRVARAAEDVAAVAAAEILALLESAIAWRGEAHLCLAGGGTPRLLHEKLRASAFEGWPHVHIWFGDERCVPPDHADSNVGMAHETLLDLVTINPLHINRLAGELEPAAAARQYTILLQAQADRLKRDHPLIDALVLGMGDDGHTASVFPGSPLLTADQELARDWCAAVYVPKLDTWRLTLTPFVLQAASAVAVLVSGASKHEALTRVVRGDAPVADLPIRLLENARGDVAWFVDHAALFD